MPDSKPEMVEVEDLTIYFPAGRTFDCSIRQDLGDAVSEPPGTMHIRLAPRTLVGFDAATGKTITRETPAERIVINLLHAEQVVRRTRQVRKEVNPFRVDELLEGKKL